MVGQLVWFITGASKGLGLALARQALLRGDLVVATARDTSRIETELFSDTRIERSHAFTLNLDISWPFHRLAQITADAVQHWGRIDVLVNNASLWVGAGASEEVGADFFQRSITTNLIGTINVTNAVLPYMRTARIGTIAIFGSRSVYMNGISGVAPYTSTKAALHAYGESLSTELKPFAIKVVVVLPGNFNTNPGGGLASTTGPPISDYDDFRKNLHSMMEKRNEIPNKGDPVKGMDALVDVVRGEGKAASKESWPLWLFLGDDGIQNVRERLKVMGDTVDRWESVGAHLEERDSA
ncbi:unnamed protein product [Peniophora sp. CBMAI 1063]|nr:unnamed protein product [Peniophora sp. CBMAI 1063]